MRTKPEWVRCLVVSITALSLPSVAIAQEVSYPDSMRQPPKIYSPYVQRTAADANFAEGVYWGDTHLHTSYSTDSGMMGNTVGPEEAFRFARGEEVITSHGLRVRLIRPLDFLVVSDHAENLGLAPFIAESNPELLKSEWGRMVHDMVKAGDSRGAFQAWLSDAVTAGTDPIANPKMSRAVWDREIAFADQFNEPGQFTAFIGFEWTSIATQQEPGNLHRVVIFKDGEDKVGQVLPFSTFDSIDPEDLWDYLAAYESRTGGSVLAIAHNGNVSNGQMFSVERLNGEPISREYAEMRSRFEPLYEVTQIKGDGEAHPLLSPNDEFADYGTWDKSDIAGFKPKEDWMLQYEYARSALQIGMQLEAQLGINPYKFGMVGSTDAHTSLATTREENFFGKAAHLEPEADRWEHTIIASLSGDPSLSSYSYESIGAGLAAVWARENTREGIFNAMQKKETYATTGTRIVVRFFGGWDYDAEEVFRPDAVSIGYRKGVPMGGDLPARPADQRAPVFMVGAMKDPWSGNLDRIQIIKGWIDDNGERQERVYDVAVSDGRTIGSDGRCRTPVGNTVNVADASYLNTIGDPELRAVWTDPDFDPNHRAFYYARVLEIPTPTWQAYDSKRFGVTMPETVQMFGQERAYTSPIWYTPGM
ncbi:MAG: DUF3604 domain-containing protein [Gemmatimonadota bacterium]|nr:MAG: DUF3604 domain-containing protein [Gemmatimonadota bacterium]